MPSEQDKNIPEKYSFPCLFLLIFTGDFSLFIFSFSYYLSSFSSFFEGPPGKLADTSDITCELKSGFRGQRKGAREVFFEPGRHFTVILVFSQYQQEFACYFLRADETVSAL